MKLSQANILLFHRVYPKRDPLWDPMDPKLFDKVLNYVSKKYTVLSLSEITAGSEIRSKKPIAAITFDDGYRDFIEYSLPILTKYKFPSSMYVVTNCIDENIPTWTYVVDHYFFHTRTLEIEDFPFEGLPEKYLITKWNSKIKRLDFGRSLKQFMKTISNDKRKLMLKHIIENFNDVNSPEGMMMNWNEIKNILSESVEVGSHTVNHPPLATLENENEIKSELYESGERIKLMTGKFPDVISYPVGSYDHRVMRIAKETGYRFGLAVNHKIYKPERDNLFEIPRLELYNEGFLKTKLRTTGFYSSVKNIFGR